MSKVADFIFQRHGVSPETRSVISMKNKVYSVPSRAKEYRQIGAVSSFEISQRRGSEVVRGIGFGDIINEIVPGYSDPVQLTVNRTALYLSNLFQVFGYFGGADGLVRALMHHRWPFDVKHEMVFSQLAAAETGVEAAVSAIASGARPDRPALAIVTFFEACWLTDYSTSYELGTAAVAENGTVVVTDVVDGKSIYSQFAETGNNPFLGQGSIRILGGQAVGV